MIKKVSVSFFLLAVILGFAYGATAIVAPQNLKVLSQLDRATLFSALCAGKMFLLAIPHWCWMVFGTLLILSVIPVWALCAIAQIDGLARILPTPQKPARSEESWRKNREKPPAPSVEPVPAFQWNLNTGHEFNVTPDRPTPNWLTLKIKCEQKSKPRQRAGQ